MPRAKKKALPADQTDTSFNPAEFDKPAEIVQSVADGMAMPPDAEREAAHETEQTHAERHKPRPRIVRHLPDTMTIPVGDMKVQLIDRGDNLAGIGIRVGLPEGRKLTDAEKDVIRSFVRHTEENKTGFHWRGDMGMWHKHIVQPGEDPASVSPTRPVAIRINAETLTQKLADGLRAVQPDHGHASRVEHEREHQGGREVG